MKEMSVDKGGEYKEINVKSERKKIVSEKICHL